MLRVPTITSGRHERPDLVNRAGGIYLVKVAAIQQSGLGASTLFSQESMALLGRRQAPAFLNISCTFIVTHQRATASNRGSIVRVGGKTLLPVRFATSVRVESRLITGAPGGLITGALIRRLVVLGTKVPAVLGDLLPCIQQCTPRKKSNT